MISSRSSHPNRRMVHNSYLAATRSLFTMGRSGMDWADAPLVAYSLRSGKRTVVMERAGEARYLDSGHLVYARLGVLYTIPFDLQRLEATGVPVMVVEGVRRAGPESTAAALYAGLGLGNARLCTRSSEQRLTSCTPLPYSRRTALPRRRHYSADPTRSREFRRTEGSSRSRRLKRPNRTSGSMPSRTRVHPDA